MSGAILTEAQVQEFKERGYLVIPGFLSKDETAALRAEAERLVSEWKMEDDSVSIFTTKEQVRKTDQYFMESGDKIRFFLEESVLKSGELSQEKSFSVNKIGHGKLISSMSEISSLFPQHCTSSIQFSEISRIPLG